MILNKLKWRPSAATLLGAAVALYVLGMGAWIVNNALQPRLIAVANRTAPPMPWFEPVAFTPLPCLEVDTDPPIPVPKARPAEAGPGKPVRKTKRDLIFPFPPLVRED